MFLKPCWRHVYFSKEKKRIKAGQKEGRKKKRKGKGKGHEKSIIGRQKVYAAE